MKPTLFFRIASILTVLFTVGHTLGFRAGDPTWGAQPVIEHMKTFRFPVGPFTRSYWDFFVGFGFFTTAFLLLAAFLAWQLGGLVRVQPSYARSFGAALTICFAANAVLSWQYFFMPPLVFSVLIFVFLAIATALSKPANVS